MDSRTNGLYEPPQALLATLEILATECPGLLGFAVRTWLESPARPDLLNLARRWGVEPEQLAATVLNTSTGLDRLERRRGGWRTPGQVINRPNLPPTLSLIQLGIVRAERVATTGRRRRLEVIVRRLERVHQREAQRAWLQKFLTPPAQPVTVNISEWIRRPLSPGCGDPDNGGAAA